MAGRPLQPPLEFAPRMASFSDGDIAARPLTARRSRALRGHFKVAPDSGLFALAAMLAALARGRSTLYRDAGAPDPDLQATYRLLEAIGARPEVADDRWEISGLGTRGLLEPAKPIDFSGAGRALPLALALLGSFDFEARLVGGRGPGRATVARAIDVLRKTGMSIGEQQAGRLPISVAGPKTPVPFSVRLDEPSGDTKAALLLAALSLPGTSMIEEVHPSSDESERLLHHFGAGIVEATGVDGVRTLAVSGLATLGARTLALPGDADLAAFPLVAALIVPDSDVVIENVPMHPARMALISALEEMGGDIAIGERRLVAGQEVADLEVRHSPLLGMSIDGRGLTPAGVPPLAVAGAFAAGETHLPRLGFAGEVALHEALAAGLSANGATARADAAGLHVGRPAAGRRLGGEDVLAGDDACLAAAFLVFGLAAADPVTVQRTDALSSAFPDLVAGLEGLGAELYWWEAA